MTLAAIAGVTRTKECSGGTVSNEPYGTVVVSGNLTVPATYRELD